MSEQSDMTGRIVAVFKRLYEGAGNAAEVDATRLYEMAERIVREEVIQESYRGALKGSPFAALGTATGVSALKESADARTLPTLDELRMTPVRAANIAADDVEAQQPEREGV